MKIGIVGYGSRISSMFDMMQRFDETLELAAIADINLIQVKDRLRGQEKAEKDIHLYTDADEMLDNEQLDGVLIGTRCSLHTEMALKVFQRHLPLFLEKPVTTSMRDYERLKKGAASSKSKVVVSFPLRVTPLAQLAKDIILSGKIGKVEHVQAFNDVPYGGVYFHSWYRDENETGGLFLQKATHDFDYINDLLGEKPVEICAMKSKQVFKGKKPAGLRCEDCDEKNTCPEGPYAMKYVRYDSPNGEYCCFAVDTGNEDSGGALIRYESGMHVNYSQNFFARKKAARRGARFIGYDGTLEFDWFTDEVKVYMHSTPRVERYQVDSSQMSHGGGDDVLAQNFLAVMRGTADSAAPLEAGLLSALMCLKATESADKSVFMKI